MARLSAGVQAHRPRQCGARRIPGLSIAARRHQDATQAASVLQALTMSFGGQTVGFVTVTRSGTPDSLGMLAESRTLTLVSGCHFRPFVSTESPEGETNTTTIRWKLTAPPEAGVLAAKSTGELVYDGTRNPVQTPASTFKVDGPMLPKVDGADVHHVTVYAKKQAG